MPRDNICMYMVHVCFMSVVVTVWGSVGMFVVQRPLLKIVFFKALECGSLLCVCVGDVMDVLFSVCIVRRGAVGARVCECECECFVMQMLYDCVLCASCGSSQCCVLHDLQSVNAGRGCNRRPYRRAILQSRSHNCFIGSHECLLLFIPSCCSECFYDL